MIKTEWIYLSLENLHFTLNFQNHLQNLTLQEDAPNENFSMLALLSQSYAIMPY